MSDAGAIIDNLEYSKKAFEKGDKLEAALCAFGAYSIVSTGNPTGLTSMTFILI